LVIGFELFLKSVENCGRKISGCKKGERQPATGVTGSDDQPAITEAQFLSAIAKAGSGFNRNTFDGEDASFA